VRAAPGVILVLTAADIPGVNDVSPIGKHDDPIFATDKVEFAGQVLFAVAAETIDAARAAAKLAVIEYEDLAPILTTADALAKQSFVLDSYEMRRGDAASALISRHTASGQIDIGGRSFLSRVPGLLAIPWRMATCSCIARPHPSEQHLIAHALDRPSNAVTVEVRHGRRFAAETQAAMGHHRRARRRQDRAGASSARPRRRHDHDRQAPPVPHRLRVGFDDAGRIQGINSSSRRLRFSADLSGAIADRAMFHADNGYYLDNARITSHRCKTNLVSNTAFRGFGGPQGMMGIEHVIDAIARNLGKDPLEIRKRNLYGTGERDVTPYHMIVEDNILPELIAELETSSDYWQRRQQIMAFNAASPYLKKGLALTPVKFGISFTTTQLNQAGALLHVYTDGSVHLNHGGTEMGQGLFIKVAQVVAEELQIDLDRIKITATNTGKVPNTSATAASSGRTSTAWQRGAHRRSRNG
jgi:xanthine dehydrogenase large subunit